MKVVQLNAVDFGSTGKIMLGIAEVSREKGIDAFTISSSRRGEVSKDGKFYFDSVLGYKAHVMLGGFLGVGTYGPYLLTKKILKKLDEINPDIIHLHITHGWYIDNPLLFKYIKKRKIKTIWTLHDCWSFTGRCPHFILAGCDRWKTACKTCVYDKKMYPASYFFDRSKSQYKKKKKMFTGIENMTLVTPSVWLSNLVKQSYMKEYPVKVINNGINLDLFRPCESDFKKKYGIEDKKVVLGVSMNWGERKGLDVMCELAKRLGDSYAVVLVGTIGQGTEELPDGIIHINRTSNQKELAEIYSAADVFANPTREDNFPTVNMEALACGTPVVTFKTGGSPEIIDENSGCVVPVNDIDAFEKEIRRVCMDKPYSKDACTKRAENFDMYDKFLEYVKLYEEL